MTKHSFSAALIFFAALLLAGCIQQNAAMDMKQTDGSAHMHSSEGHFAQHYSDSLFQVTDNNLYSVELLFKGGQLSVGMNSADIIIHRDTEKAPDVEKAQITLTPWMPEHGHGVQTVPVITERGSGLYSVENLEFIMEGHWQLKVAIDGPEGVDRTIFDFPAVAKTRSYGSSQHQHAMKMDMSTSMNPPPGTDLGTTQQSVRKLYRVSYVSSENPLPINRIHSWQLTVHDASGRPVSGLDIQVDGDMPAHGHGLPTKPKVSRETIPGTYVVEGMKFSMPGWWKITFYIKRGEETDSVIFNLQVL